MVNYGLFSQLKLLLSEYSSLTPYLKLTPGLYWQKSIEYLERLQCFSDKYNLYFSSDIALAVSKLLTFSEDKQISVAAKRNIRKQKDQFAVTCLENIHKEIKGYIEQSRVTFEESGNVWRQVLAQAFGKGLLMHLPAGEEKLDHIIGIVKSDSDLMPYYLHLLGTMGIFNVRAVLDTILPELLL